MIKPYTLQITNGNDFVEEIKLNSMDDKNAQREARIIKGAFAGREYDFLLVCDRTGINCK